MKLVNVGSQAAPVVLKRMPALFDASGLVVTRHEALAQDGERIPYVQVGPAAGDGAARVHLYGYGGFEVSERPYYRSHIGKLWLERGGIAVVANIRGGGEFGPRWHEAGIRERKMRGAGRFRRRRRRSRRARRDRRRSISQPKAAPTAAC